MSSFAIHKRFACITLVLAADRDTEDANTQRFAFITLVLAAEHFTRVLAEHSHLCSQQNIHHTCARSRTLHIHHTCARSGALVFAVAFIVKGP